MPLCSRVDRCGSYFARKPEQKRVVCPVWPTWVPEERNRTSAAPVRETTDLSVRAAVHSADRFSQDRTVSDGPSTIPTALVARNRSATDCLKIVLHMHIVISWLSTLIIFDTFSKIKKLWFYSVAVQQLFTTIQFLQTVILQHNRQKDMHK